MHREHPRPVVGNHSAHRTKTPTKPEAAPEFNLPHPHILNLQRVVGNRALQRLISQGQLTSRGVHQAKPAIQRCGCGGTCAACKGEDVSAGMEPQLQRFWDDEEESDDSGGSWIDSATDWLTGGDDSGGGSTEDSGGSWWSGQEEDGEEYVAPWSESEDSESAEQEETSESDSESSWWDDLWSDEGDEEEGDDDWLPDWLPDIEIPFFSDEEPEEEEPIDLDDEDLEVEVAGAGEGQGTCVSGHGSGTSGGVTAAGLTTIDWTAATGKGSFLNPTISKRTVGNKTVYDVSGKVHIDYSGADAKISFNITPPLSQLSECKQEKVNAFTGSGGKLGQHEAQHKAKMDAFNGSEEFDHTFTGLEASSTDELTQKVNAALDALVKPKITARQASAQSESDKLDPWSEPIPGIESCKS